jgi:protein-tyrosine phosphatase
VRVLTLCTGNVARSAMLAAMLEVITENTSELDLDLRSAGTLAVEGLGVSPRTLAALAAIPDMMSYRLTAHRSRQLTDDLLDWSDAVLAVEASQVAYVEARHPESRDKVVHLGTACTTTLPGASTLDRLRAGASLAPDESLDVPDPAGGDQATYDDCARQLWELARRLVTLVTVGAD